MEVNENLNTPKPILSVLSTAGEKINLFKVDLKDAWSICDFVVVNESRLTAFFPKTKAANLTPELSRQFVALKTKEFEDRKEFLYTIKVAKSKKVLGLLYLKELDWEKRQGEFAYCIDYTLEGKGITTKIVDKLSEYAFKILGLKTLQIIVHSSNIASVQVAIKCSFVWQKTLKESYNPTGKQAMNMELYERYQ